MSYVHLTPDRIDQASGAVRVAAGSGARPLARAANASVGTAGGAFAVPATPRPVRHAKVTTDGDAYVGIGTAGSPPAANAANTAHLGAGETEVWTLDPATDGAAYAYVYAAAGTVSVRISWYG